MTKGKYWMGVDFGSDDDYSAYTVVRHIRWYERMWRFIRRDHSKWQYKVVSQWIQKEPKPKKYRGKP